MGSGEEREEMEKEGGKDMHDARIHGGGRAGKRGRKGRAKK